MDNNISQFNPNEVTAEIVKKLTESAISKLWSEAQSAAVKAYLKGKVFLRSYQRYVARVSKDYYFSKSFLISDTKTAIYDFYVPLGISRGNTSYPEATIQNLTAVENFNIITGTGGCGKTMMMKHLFLNTLQHADRVPILVELRDLNDGDTSLVDLIRETLWSNDFEQNDEFFALAIKAGHFAIFLDGFDETTEKQKVARQIQKLAKAYPSNLVVVSSRPDDKLEGWSHFNVWRIDPLTLGKASDLVQKVPDHIFDAKVRKKFLSDLKNSLFESHRSFLSNPLLLSIMVLTYKDSADIPRRITLFYDQAYSTLFQRHDAAKGGFTRKRQCPELDSQEFERIFSAFCILTFDKRKTTFTQSEALDFLEKSKKLVDVEFKSPAFLDDAIQAVSLLVRDGLSIVFAHRSFQEYFAARYIQSVADDTRAALVGKYISRNGDTVVDLLYDLGPDDVERSYLIPQIAKLEEALFPDQLIGPASYPKFLRSTIKSFEPTFMRMSEGSSEVIYFPWLTDEGERLWGMFQLLDQNYLRLKGFPQFMRIDDLHEFKELVEASGIGKLDPTLLPERIRKKGQELFAYSISEILEHPRLVDFLHDRFLPFTAEFIKAVFQTGKELKIKHKKRGESIIEELLR